MSSIGVPGVGSELGSRPQSPEMASPYLGRAVERLARSQEELTKAVWQMVERSAAEGAADVSGVAIDLDYTDAWPEVEVSVVINEVLRFDLHDLTFDADFTVHLDWTDEKLKRGDHYQYNAEHAKFELVKTLQHCMDDDMRFFNPTVVIENSTMDPDSYDALPQVYEEVSGPEGVDVPWLAKSFHFLGSLSCRHADASYFPFDIQGLMIRIKCPDMAGVTSLGQKRRIVLREPVLRPTERKKVVAGSGVSYIPTLPSAEVACHAWKQGTDGSKTLDVGELQIMAMGGSYNPTKQQYDVYIVTRRRCRRYYNDMIIQNLEVMVALASIYVPFNVDTLANRLSISLTILLTVVAASGSRPPAVESVPYSTLHDTYAQLIILCSIFITLMNVVVFQNCWGTFRGPHEDYFDAAANMVLSDIGKESHFGEEMCQASRVCLGASGLDCVVALATVGLLFLALLVTCLRGQMHRINMILRIKHEVDATDCSPGKFSRLAIYKFPDSFEFQPRSDVVGYIMSGGVLPFVYWFWRVWCVLHRLHKKLFLWMLPDDTFHACDAEELLAVATRKSEEIKHNLPQMSAFHHKLSPFDTFRVMDVGSGEMGCYSYWLDQRMHCVRSAGTAEKLKYRKGCTFVDHFITDPGGIQELCDHLDERFGGRPETASGEMRFSVSTPAPQSPAITLADTLRSAASVPMSPSVQDVGEVPVGEVPGSVNDSPAPKGAEEDGNMRTSSLSPLGTSVLASTAVVKMRSAKVLRTSGDRGKKRKILMCLTGANRQMLRDDVDGRAQLDNYVKSVNKGIEQSLNMEILAFSPEDRDEAMYELWATEWVVQHGDLDVGGMKLDKSYKTLQRGQADATATWDEVNKVFGDLRAEFDLQRVYCSAAGMAIDDFLSEEQLPPSVVCSAFYNAFDASPSMIRALLRARLFAGTISAGSGSSQVTLRSSGSLDTSQVHSIPVGNRSPLVNQKITPGHHSALFNKTHPRTKSAAESLFCGGIPASKCSEMSRAWGEDGPVDPHKLETWSNLVTSCCEEKGLPSQRRGLFVGISAVFYAAKTAKCDQQILERDKFLELLRAKRSELMDAGGTKGRDLANLTLVISLVESVLHKNAQIVCKRNWKVGDEDFVATWTLGMYLKHSGVMGIPLKLAS